MLLQPRRVPIQDMLGRARPAVCFGHGALGMLSAVAGGVRGAVDVFVHRQVDFIPEDGPVWALWPSETRSHARASYTTCPGAARPGRPRACRTLWTRRAAVRQEELPQAAAGQHSLSYRNLFICLAASAWREAPSGTSERGEAPHSVRAHTGSLSAASIDARIRHVATTAAHRRYPLHDLSSSPQDSVGKTGDSNKSAIGPP
jgi:hypothetical protein